MLEDRDKTEEITEHESFMRKIFVKPTNELEALREKQMQKYIASKMNDDDHQAEKSKKTDIEEEILGQMPEMFKSDNKRIQEGAEKTIWKQGLTEVPLSIKHKLDNIERTELTKRRAIKDVSVPESRFSELHNEEYERFNYLHSENRKEQKILERLEKNYVLRGKRLKEDRKERSEMNRRTEESWR